MWPPITVRSAKPEDIPVILRLERSAQSAAHWTESAYAGVFSSASPARILLVAEDSSEYLCGFVVARIAVGECELENIVVEPGYARQGIGTSLMQALLSSAHERGAERIFLEVRQSNHAARGLYKKFKFVQDGRRDDYYRDPVEAAILYSCSI